MWKYAGEGSEIMDLSALGIWIRAVEAGATETQACEEVARHYPGIMIKAPETRPGVMIKAEEDTLGSGMVSRIDRNRGEVTITLANLEDVVNFELGMQLSTAYEYVDRGDNCMRGLAGWIPSAPLAQLNAYPDHRDLNEVKRWIEVKAGVPNNVTFDVTDEGRSIHLKFRASGDYGLVTIDWAAIAKMTDPQAFWDMRVVESRGLLSQMKVPTTPPTQPVPVKATSRTCPTCSKTCDVGVKCWWCGNE
jgi:hypothetical protein